MDVLVKIDLSITVTVSSGGSDLAYDLHKEATVFKENGDWPSTIATLERAKAHMLTSRSVYSHSYWSRLAKFYQYAGRYEDSMREFDFLIADLERRVPLEHFIDNPNICYGKESKSVLIRRSIRAAKAKFKNERLAVQDREARRLKQLDKAAAKKIK